MTVRPATACGLATLSTLLVWAACTGPTEGRSVRIRVLLEPSADGPGFTTTTGWEVTLDEAAVAVGPLYVYAPEGSARRSGVTLLGRALAHGGVDPVTGRRVRAEWLGQAVLDALGTGPVDLGEAMGEEGEAAAVGIALEPPSAEITGPVSGYHAWVAGTARRGGEVIAFEGGLELPEEPLVRRVPDVPLDARIEEGGTLRIAAVPAAWLDAAHFERLEPTVDGSPRRIDADTQVHAALYLGLRSTRAWRARFETGEDR